MCNKHCGNKKEQESKILVAVFLLVVFLLTIFFLLCREARAEVANGCTLRCQQQIAGEVQRQHELRLISAQELVLDKRIELGREQQTIVVNNSNTVGQRVKQETNVQQRQEANYNA